MTYSWLFLAYGIALVYLALHLERVKDVGLFRKAIFFYVAGIVLTVVSDLVLAAVAHENGPAPFFGLIFGALSGTFLARSLWLFFGSLGVSPGKDK